jgi:hypothetical protein
MKKILIIAILSIGGLFISCSSDGSDDNTTKTPVTPIIIPQPSATTLSSEFLFTGDLLEIVGTNFVNKDYPTKIFINDIEVSPKEISNTKIQLLITDAQKAGVNTLKIQIEKVSSMPVNFFIIAKGWNKVDALENKDVHTSCVFDESKTIFSFVNTSTNKNLIWGAPQKLEGKSTGYTPSSINPQSGIYADFKMIDERTGVLTNGSYSFFTVNCFETQNLVDGNINSLRIGYLDNKSCILTTELSSQIYTADKGLTIIKNEPPTWGVKIANGGIGIYTRLSINSFGKSTSNEKFYQLGLIYDLKKYGSNNYKNVVLESETGYSNWIVKDTVSDVNPNLSWMKYKFLNINKIFSINANDKTLHESNDMLKTWKVIKTDVTSIFLRTETQWYIQSGDKLYVTTDSGQTWNLELELPAGSIVNDISFSKSKIIVSGNKGLLYLKIE